MPNNMPIQINVEKTETGFLITHAIDGQDQKTQRVGTEAEAAEVVGDLICDAFEGGEE